MARIIRSSGVIEEFKQEPSLEELQGVVGGYIESIRIPGTPNKVLIVNEEGRLKALPVNPAASRIAYQEIVGDVLICEQTAEGRLL